MRHTMWTLALVGGCAVAPADSEVQGDGAALPRAFAAASAPGAPDPAVTFAATSEGVTLRLGGAQSAPLPVVTEGVGPVRSARADGARGLVLAHAGGVEEHWAPVPAGAEQSWHFPARPVGDAVAVEVSLGGARFERAADDGVWLRTAEGARVRYGHGTWVDADGRRTAVPARWTGTRVALQVPAAVVAASRFPAVLDPLVTSAFALEPADQFQYYPRVGLPVSVMVPTPTGSLLFGANAPADRAPGTLTVQQRDAAGALVPGSFRVLAADRVGFGWLQAAAYSGGVWLAWRREPESAGTGVPSQIMAMRVDLTGRPLDPAPLLLVSAYAYGGPYQVACTSAQCLVLSGGFDYQRLSSDGRLLDATPQHLVSPSPLAVGVTLAALTDRYVVAWSDVPTASTVDVLVARIGLDGRVLDPGGRPATTAGSSRSDPALATDGSRLFLTFRAQAAGSRPAGVYTLLLDGDLNPLAPVSVITEPGFEGRRVLWDGSDWLVVSSRNVARFSGAGAPLDAAPAAIAWANPAGGITRTVLGPAPGGFFALELSPVGTAYSAGVQRHASDGALVGAHHPLPVRGLSTAAPRVDANGGEFLATYASERESSPPRLARVSASGAVRIAPRQGAVPAMLGPALALEGSTALLFGTIGGEGFQTFAVDLTTGTASAPQRLSASPLFGVAVRGPDQRMVFAAATNATPGYLARFGPSGAQLDLAGTALPVMRSVAADYDGSRYLYVYPALISGQWRAFARRVDTAGDFVDLSPRSLDSLGVMHAGLGLAFGGGTHLMAWIDPSLQVRAVRLGADGAPAAGAVLSLGAAGAAPVYAEYERDREVQVVFDGTNFVVAWLDGVDLRVRAVLVSPAGVPLDAAPFVLSPGGLDAPTTPLFAAASDGRGSTLVLHEVFDRAVGAIQVRGAFLREDGTVVPDGGVAADAGSDVPAVVDVPAMVDVRIADATAVDATLDAGVSAVDVSTADAGAHDGAALEAAVDAGTADDRPSAADAGEVDAGVAPATEGGLCSVRGGPGSSRGGLPAASLLLGLVGLRRRRRTAA